MTDDQAPDRSILHILVVGFHHKRGQQVEFCHPAWSQPDKSHDDNTGKSTDISSVECPAQWRHLASLAIPDGVHNNTRDCIFFNLPALDERETRPLSCVACFRQVCSDSLLVKTDDITRSTVQKSVVVMSRLPLYGYIQSLLDPLVDEYIRSGDFTKVDILRCGYSWLNQMVSVDLLSTPHIYTGLSVKSFVLKFGHLSLQLLKLVLLERRILMLDQSAGHLSNLLLTLVSLLPAIFHQSPDCSVTVDSHSSGDSRETPPVITDSRSVCVSADEQKNADAPVADINTEKQLVEFVESVADSTADQSAVSSALSAADLPDTDIANTGDEVADHTVPASESKSSGLADWLYNRPVDDSAVSTDVSTELLHRVITRAHQCASLDHRQCGMPLSLFTQGYLLRPYLSLNEIELLEDVSVRAILAAATNSLFALKNHLIDACVTMDPQPQLQLFGDQLRRQLTMSTEDLRFAELLVRLSDSCRCEDNSSDHPSLCQCETTLRNMFCLYVFSLLRSSLTLNQEEVTTACSAFNSCYVSAFRRCHAYRQWHHLPHDLIFEVNPVHPCSGQLTVQDVRLRISHTMQSTEQMRKVSSVAAATGRAVGGALSAARGSLNNFWNSISTPSQAGHG